MEKTSCEDKFELFLSELKEAIVRYLLTRGNSYNPSE
jgi:hypothetical protein